MITVGSVFPGRHDRYQILEEQGRGGFGITYRCRRLRAGGEAILKVLRLERLASWKALELFEREAAVLRALSHPAIPAWLDDFVLGDPAAPEGFALVQELIPGKTLEELMKTPGVLGPDAMLAWLDGMLEVLAYLHERTPPVIHRDVTPRNVILRPDGRPALIDFGTVQAALREASAVSSTAAGSFGYAPLEQFVGRAGPTSDLYGLGMTYLALAVGREPSELPLLGPRVDVRSVLTGDRRLIALIESMTAADPRQRPPTARAAREQLARLGSPEIVGADGAGADEPRVSSPEAYLALLDDRLRGEGFSTMTGGQIGEQPLLLTAVRRRGARHPWAVRVVVAQAPEDVRAGWLGDLLAAAGSGRHDAGPLSSLAGRPVVIAVVLGPTSAPLHGPDANLAGQADIVPVMVDLGSGEARVGNRGGGRRRTDHRRPDLLSYAWWLATPRLLDRPAPGLRSSLWRVAIGVAAGITMLCAAGLAAVLSLPHGRFFLSYAASPDAGQIAVKELYRGRFWLGTAVHVLDAAGEERARTTLPADAYLCELQRESIGYWRLADGGDAVFIRAPLRGGEEREVARIPAPERWSCAIREGELVFPLRGADSGAGLWRKRENEPARPVLGSASRDQDPAWFPDGRSLVVSASQHQRLCRIDLATGARTFLLPDERGSQSRPAVSPDGRALAFLGSAPRSFGDVERRGTSLVHDLRLLDLTTGQSRLLVQDVCFSAPPVWWSPHELLLAKWLDDRCALFRYDLRTEQTTLLARRY